MRGRRRELDLEGVRQLFSENVQFRSMQAGRAGDGASGGCEDR